MKPRVYFFDDAWWIFRGVERPVMGPYYWWPMAIKVAGEWA